MNDGTSVRKPLVCLTTVVLLVLSIGLRATAQEQAPAAVDMQTQPSAPAPKPQPADGPWHLSFTPYLWLAGAHGTVGALGRDVSFHASPGDLLKHLDIGLMGGADYRYNRYLLNGDLLWIRLSDSRALPITGGAVSADARVGELVWTSKMGYRVIDHEKLKADALVGARFWHLGQKVSFNPSLLGIDFQRSQNWVDFVLGGRVQLPLGEKTVIDLSGDVGGWGAQAKLDYQFATLLSHRISSRWALVAGYRYLFVDYRRNAAALNLVTSGVLIGATYRYK